jgi:predicted DCC family thiol-disulfide oxidoreductase YuxK
LPCNLISCYTTELTPSHPPSHPIAPQWNTPVRFCGIDLRATGGRPRSENFLPFAEADLPCNLISCYKFDVSEVACPPPKPLMVFDGDCNFCRRWISRWQQATGDRLDYRPFQDAGIAQSFPELPRERFEASVHLIEPDGRVFSGAEAVFRSLAHVPRRRWQLWLYEHAPGVAPVTEAAYRFVARHRTVFSALTKLLWGAHVERPTYFLCRWIFLRLLGVIYLIAFVSLWTQITGLVGENGIIPAKNLLVPALEHNGYAAYWMFPTLAWFNLGDGFLKFMCGAGAVLSVLLIVGIAPAIVSVFLWALYLSLVVVGQDFLAFQWDILLLETGFLAIFFAPWQLLPGLRRESPPPAIARWLLWWLLFRLVFESGVVKLSWNDPTWRDLTALTFHYETQPLPTWIGWYAHQLPVWFQKFSCAGMFAVELGAPFLIFTPRRLRFVGCGAMIGLQVLIALTGNYCFFNLLTIALCVLLLDDAALGPVGRALRARRAVTGRDSPPYRSARWQNVLMMPVVIATLLVTPVQLASSFRTRIPMPRPLRIATFRTYQYIAPFHSMNAYGLFRVMTTSRSEIIIEGSNDGLTWQAYEFKWKPGELKRRPGFNQPHQPRLDWQMWFAALGDFRQNPWFVQFCVRLLEGSPEVLTLLKTNPFPEAPPRYIRAMVYDYRFTDFATRRQTGEWWQRKLLRPYLPAISLRNE